jgi:hypothetical protein
VVDRVTVQVDRVGLEQPRCPKPSIEIETGNEKLAVSCIAAFIVTVPGLLPPV